MRTFVVGIALLAGFQVACGDDGSAGTGTSTSSSSATGSGGGGSGGEASGGSSAGGGGAGGEGTGGGCAGCTGEHLWSKRFGGSGDQTANASVDADGSVLVGCRFEGMFGFDGFEVSATNAGQGELDGCAAKLDDAGAALWAHAFGATATGGSFAPPSADAGGSMYVSTTFDGSVNLGDTGTTSTGGLDMALARLSSEGAAAWAKGFGSAGDQQITSVAAIAGGAFATGAFEGTLGPLTSAGAYDVWVAKVSEAGEPVWFRNFGSAGFDSAYSVAPTADGGVVFAGGFEGTVDFGGGPLQSAGSFDGFVAKLDANGNHVWSKRFGDMDGFIQISATVDSDDGDVVVVLGTTQVVDFGGGPTRRAASTWSSRD